MTSSIKFLVTSLISYVTGILAVSGHLDTSSTNSLTVGFQDIIGGILIVAPIVYNLEHHSKTSTTTVTANPNGQTATVTTNPEVNTNPVQ